MNSQAERSESSARRHWRLRCSASFALILALAAVSDVACNHPTASPPRSYVAFVANRQGNSVAAVDLGNLRMLSSIPVSPSPTQVTQRPGTMQLYAVSGSGTLSVIAFPELRVVKTIGTGRSAASLVFSPDGRRAYVLDPSDNRIVFVDCERQRVIGHLRFGGKPSSVALTPDGKVLLITAMPSDLFFVDAESRKELGRVEIGENPGTVLVRLDGKQAFVSGMAHSIISAVDVSSRQLLANLAVAAPVTSLISKPDGGEIFALSSSGSRAITLDAYHDDVEQTITTGQNPMAGVFRSDASAFYIATGGDGNITALDVPTRSVISTVHAGTQPSSLALTPDERFLVVADAASSSLAVLRTDSLGLVTTIPVGTDPVHVVVPDWVWKGGTN